MRKSPVFYGWVLSVSSVMWASLSCMRCCCCCWRGGGTATATAHKLTNFCSLSSCVAEGSLQSLFSWCESSRGIGDSLDWRCEGEISIRIFRLISQLARSGPASDGWWRWRGGADGERQLQPVSWCSCSDLVTAGHNPRGLTYNMFTVIPYCLVSYHLQLPVE